MLRYSPAWMRIVLSALCAIVFVGCAPRPSIAPVNQLELPGATTPEAFPAASAAEWSADPARLADDIERAIKDMHWGKLSLRAEPEQPKERPIIRAAALLPEDRSAHIAAWGIDDKHVRVTVRVGHFGDTQAEQQFINALAERLHGKPKPQRGGKFVLPP